MAANESGALGERAAADYLLKNGFTVTDKNYRCRYGEIDIIAADSHYIVFVEVKTRKDNSLFAGREAVDARKQTKLIKTASIYLGSHNVGELQPRFDVAEVVLYNQKDFKIKEINYIENAFTL